MTDDNYMNAIREAQNLLNELLDDPEHGKLTFKGINGLADLTITTPYDLDCLESGTVLTIVGGEWMRFAMRGSGHAWWQHYGGEGRMTSDALYRYALEREANLQYCYKGQ